MGGLGHAVGSADGVHWEAETDRSPRPTRKRRAARDPRPRPPGPGLESLSTAAESRAARTAWVSFSEREPPVPSSRPRPQGGCLGREPGRLGVGPGRPLGDGARSAGSRSEGGRRSLRTGRCWRSRLDALRHPASPPRTNRRLIRETKRRRHRRSPRQPQARQRGGRAGGRQGGRARWAPYRLRAHLRLLGTDLREDLLGQVGGKRPSPPVGDAGTSGSPGARRPPPPAPGEGSRGDTRRAGRGRGRRRGPEGPGCPVVGGEVLPGWSARRRAAGGSARSHAGRRGAVVSLGQGFFDAVSRA